MLTRIDNTIDSRCACGCGQHLAPTGASGWWASEDCQKRWQWNHAGNDTPAPGTTTRAVLTWPIELPEDGARRLDEARRITAPGGVTADAFDNHLRAVAAQLTDVLPPAAIAAGLRFDYTADPVGNSWLTPGATLTGVAAPSRTVLRVDAGRHAETVVAGKCANGTLRVRPYRWWHQVCGWVWRILGAMGWRKPWWQ